MDRADHYSDHMARRVSATEAKARILALLDQVEAGEEVEITRHGRLIARLVPARPGHALKGLFAGKVQQVVGDDELLAPASEAWFTGWDWIADPDQEAP
jgi:prevent-host-death family protein